LEQVERTEACSASRILAKKIWKKEKTATTTNVIQRAVSAHPI